MSNGDYCVVRPLGLVPGGKGMRHHENLLRLTPKGLAEGVWRALGAVRVRSRPQAAVDVE